MENALYYLQAFAPLILIMFALWFFMIRPQKKRDNETKKMRNNLIEGDEIVTIGGIIGKVLSVKDDSIVVYVGSDKTKMEFKKWAVAEVTRKNEKAAAAKAKAEEPVEEAPQKKKIKKLGRKEEAAEETAPAQEAAPAETPAE